MKQRIDLQLLATIGGGILFNYLFWMEKQALNLFIYSIFIVLIILLDKEKRKNKKFYLGAGMHLLAATLVIINQSILTIITWYTSLAVMVGFVHFQLLKSIFTALFASFLQLVTAPVNLIKKIIATRFSGISFRPALKMLKYMVIPFFAITLFTILYSAANTIFSVYLHQITSGISILISNTFNFFFADISLLRFMHLLLGILLSAGIFISLKDLDLERAEAGCDEILIRKRRNKKSGSIAYQITALFAESLLRRTMALKTENVIGIISFLALNVLLLFLNVIDITTLWMGKSMGLNESNYSAELHDGTNALILSILVAMLVILYFFSGNLNFYRKNNTIRFLAYLWIIQNIFLVFSVLLRDYHYIHAHGLTYKRIGVLIFLLLCTVGLATVYVKVAKRKTFFYLCKVNGFIWYVLLLVAGFINWDVLIVTYNISKKDSITLDFNHLTGLSDKTLPLLDKNKQLLKKYLPASSYTYGSDYDIAAGAGDPAKTTNIEQIQAFEKNLNQRISSFKKNYTQTSWLSWNYRDWQTQQYLTKNHL